MSKARNCAERTINIAKQNCSKKTNLLVYEKPVEKPGNKISECKPPPKATYVPPITCPHVKKIRICTGAELKKMCQPPPCSCTPKVHVTLWQRLMRLLSLAIRSGIALGAIYVTYDMGIWGDSEQSRELYLTICEQIMPGWNESKEIKRNLSPSCRAESELFGIYKQDTFCCDKTAIDHESRIYDLQQKWNYCVTRTFASIANLPALLGNYFIPSVPGCNPDRPEDCIRCEEDDEECEN